MTIIRAPSKLNIFLEVLRKREDNYHDIISLMVRVNLCDELEVSFVEKGCEIVCDDSAIPSGKENTVFKAIEFFGEKLKGRGIKVKIFKNIPPGSGLGGGSSDAASIIRFLTSKGEYEPLLKEIAFRVGGDVPFFLNGKSAVVKGIGEEVMEVSVEDVCFLLFVPPFSISTKNAYSLIDKYSFTPFKFEEKEHYSYEDLKNLCFNRFLWVHEREKSNVFLFYSKVKGIAGNHPAGLTGSGSCLFMIFKERGERDEVRDFLEKKLEMCKIYNVEMI